MIDIDLTVKRGLDEVGEVVSECEIVLDKDSDIVFLLKKINHCLDSLCGDLYNNHRCEKAEKIVQSLKNEYWDICPHTNFHKNYFYSIFTEALMNAIEHGTSFCTKGEVKVSSMTGKGTFLSIISQNTSGINQEKISELESKNHGGNFLYVSNMGKNNRRRGRGLTHYYRENSALVGFENTPEEFKVIILGTIDHYKKVCG